MANRRVRSFSFDGVFPSVGTENELIQPHELEAEVGAVLRERKQKNGPGKAYLRRSHWLGRLCMLPVAGWKRKHLVLTQDRLVICESATNPYGIQMLLRDLCAEVTNSSGHSDLFFCLRVKSPRKSVELSFDSREDLEFWLLQLNGVSN